MAGWFDGAWFDGDWWSGAWWSGGGPDGGGSGAAGAYLEKKRAVIPWLGHAKPRVEIDADEEEIIFLLLLAAGFE